MPPTGGAGEPPTGPGGKPPTGEPERPNGVLVGVVVMVAVLLLAGGAVGAWWLLRDADRSGAPSAEDAVEAFLSAVYRDRDAAAASALVCAEARDEDSLAAKIRSIRSYGDRYDGPRFTWTPPEVVERSDGLATVQVTVTMITADERVADQPLRVSVRDKSAQGWWVCDVATEPTGGQQPGEGASGQPGDGESPAGD